MNLLDKKLLGVILILSLAIFSCEEENELGSNINPAEDKLKVEFKDFNLPASNIFFDSVRTDLDPYILTGTIDDPIYGKIKVTGYQNINILSSSLPAQDAELDSVKISLKYNAYHTGVGNKMHELIVNQVADTLYPGVIYRSNQEADLIQSFDGPSEVGRYSFEVIPGKDTTITFRLNDSYGKGLLSELKVLGGLDFRGFAPGEINALALNTTDNNQALLGFDPGVVESNITLHYHTPDDDSLRYLFVFGDASGNDLSGYNYAEVDRSGSVLSELTGEKGQIVNPSSEFVFMNPLTGVYPMVNINEVYDFLKERSDNETSLNIISAQIIMPIDPSDTTNFERTTTDLRYYFSDDQGNFNGGNVLTNPSISVILTDNSYLITSGNLQVGQGALDNNLYSITREITYFIQRMIENLIKPDEEGGFPSNLIMIPASPSSFSQTSFFRDGIKIRVYYTILN